MRKIFEGRRGRRLAATLVASLALAATSMAAARERPPESTTVLAFDTATQEILKAENGALYRRPMHGGWRKVSPVAHEPQARVTALAISRPAPNLVYVAVADVGILRSVDGGRTWMRPKPGLPARNVDVLATHATQSKTVYAFVDGKGIYRSEDEGDHWRLMGAGPKAGIVQLIHTDMPGSMQSGWLFAATRHGAARSMDCFCGWRDAGSVARSLNSIAYDPQQPRRVYAAAGNELLVSEDGGEHWSARTPSAPIRALAATPQQLIALGADGKLSASSDHGETWERIDG